MSKSHTKITVGDDSYFAYYYEQAANTVDCLVFWDGKILLIKRNGEPYKGCWALPGGYLDVATGETFEQAATRELKEEVSLDVNKFGFVGYYDDPDRDPRGRVISFAFAAAIDAEEASKIKAGSDAGWVQWIPVEELHNYELAFDHKKIINDCLKKHPLLARLTIEKLRGGGTLTTYNLTEDQRKALGLSKEEVDE